MTTTILTVLLMTSIVTASEWDDEMRRANALQQERRYDEAAAAYQAAVEKASQFGALDWRYAQASNNYAAHLYERGDYRNAAEQYSRAIAGFRATGQQVNAGIAMCNLAVLYRVTGRYTDAIDSAQGALRIYSKEFPQGSLYHVTCGTNLAEALNSAGRRGEAEAAARNAVAIAQRIGGPDDIRTGNALHVLGNVLHSSGRSGAALPVLERAIAIRKARLGAEHPAVGTAMGTYSAALFQTGNLPAAEQSARESVRILEAGYGSEHVHLIGALNSLAQVVAVRQPEDAEPLYRRALSIAEKRLGPNHPDTAKMETNFADYYTSIGRLRAAEALYRRAAESLRAGVGVSHPAYVAVQERLADLYARLGRLTEARSIRREIPSFGPATQSPAGFAADRRADELR